jgi:hypothetical protein
LAVWPAEVWPVLALIVAGALGNQAQSVDRDLNGHHHAFFARVPALHGVDLLGERIESRSTAKAEKQLQLVIGRSLGDSSLDQLDLIAGE